MLSHSTCNSNSSSYKALAWLQLDMKLYVYRYLTWPTKWFLLIGYKCRNEKFEFYLVGRKSEVETDHKPLISFLGEKDLLQLPLRVLRFKMRLMRYDFSIPIPLAVVCILQIFSAAHPIHPAMRIVIYTIVVWSNVMWPVTLKNNFAPEF